MVTAPLNFWVKFLIFNLTLFFIFLSQDFSLKIAAFLFGISRALISITFWPESPSMLLDLRRGLEINISKWFPSPESSFIQGLLLGNQGKLSRDFLEALRITGLSHVVALSGYNISVILRSSKLLLNNFWWALSVVIFFIAFTGASASVVRAGFMGVMLMLYRKFGRVSDATWIIGISAVIMVFLEPRVLLFDLGFALSFLATLGVIAGVKLFPKIPDILSTTLGATIFTTPLILWKFSRVSLISPLANLIVVPLVPYLMLISAVNVGVFFVFKPLGEILSYPAYMAFHAVVLVINFLAKIPYASI